MNIVTKYQCSDTLFFLHRNKVRQLNPISVKGEQVYEVGTTYSIRITYTFSIPDDENPAASKTFELPESKVFGTKQELLNSL